MIPINLPLLGEEEIEAVVQVLRSGVLTHALGQGPTVKKFEEEFAEFVGAKHAIAVNSGTAALHIAIESMGIKSGDEVILPSFTFVATAEAVVWAGAKPVFVDIDPETYNISPLNVEKSLTEKTKAIIAVDLYGAPADIKPIKEVAEKHGIGIIEDAAQAHGATYMGKHVGAYADVACFSFYASKNMTTGEGGMITTNDNEIAEKCKGIRSHGEKEKYKSIWLGHNYRMPEMEAAIGRVQLKKLPGFLEKRRKNADELSAKLKSASSLLLPKEREGCSNSWYLYTVRAEGTSREKRDMIIEQLRKKGVGAEVYYPIPIHLMPYYTQFGGRRLPETEKASEQVFSLPVHPGVTSSQIEFISRAVLHLIDSR
ncbi:MAG: DegT/DnrJ/EryC1/StrS family aminotransferase [Candidatus Bathyarchaeia archaeon]